MKTIKRELKCKDEFFLKNLRFIDTLMEIEDVINTFPECEVNFNIKYDHFDIKCVYMEITTPIRTKQDREIVTTIFAMIIGNFLILSFGLLRLSLIVGFHNALVTGVYPFIIGDMIKIGLAAVLLPAAWKLLAKISPHVP